MGIAQAKDHEHHLGIEPKSHRSNKNHQTVSNGQAVFISENIDTEHFTNSCNGGGDGFQDYLQALETPFVGKTASDLSRSTFSTAIQERNEPIPLFASKLISLYESAFPDKTSTNKNILVIDLCLSGLKDEEQIKFVLQQKVKMTAWKHLLVSR